MTQNSTGDFDYGTDKRHPIYPTIINGHWQLCPKCNGGGIVYTNWEGFGEFSTTCTCDVCNGQKIINIYSGKPPLSV